MEVIKRIPNWQELYPAFYLCDQLNTNGISGWYLPARNEVNLINRARVWTSTEIDNRNAFFGNSFFNKDYAKNSVYAVHKF